MYAWNKKNKLDLPHAHDKYCGTRRYNDVALDDQILSRSLFGNEYAFYQFNDLFQFGIVMAEIWNYLYVKDVFMEGYTIERCPTGRHVRYQLSAEKIQDKVAALPNAPWTLKYCISRCFLPPLARSSFAQLEQVLAEEYARTSQSPSSFC